MPFPERNIIEWNINNQQTMTKKGNTSNDWDFSLTLSRIGNYISVEVAQFKTGMQFKFNLMNITYSPTGSKVGNVSFTGKRLQIEIIRNEYVTLSRSFWPNKRYKRFEGSKEVEQYSI